MDWLKKYKETLLYVFFGALTTLVSLGSFKVCNLLFGEGWHHVSNVISWVLAVATAYVTNKLWVFKSRSWAPAVLRRELPTFVGARVFSLGIEAVGLFLTIDLLGLGAWQWSVLGFLIEGEDVCKLLLQVVVLILNYVFSKLVIFKKKA